MADRKRAYDSYNAYDDRHYRPQKKPYRDQDHSQKQHQHRQQQQQYGRDLPPLPPVAREYESAPFTHRSAANESRSVAGPKHVTYERLEFMGDAYLEVFASDLIFDRFQHLPVGQMSQIRELLVKNETLADFSRAYGFDKRLSVNDLSQMQRDAHKGNKGLNKVLGDVFEAYIAAIILSDQDRFQGMATAKKWAVALWEPKLHEAVSNDKFYRPEITNNEGGGGGGDPRKTYDHEAKATLQRRILGPADRRLDYEPWKDSVELKGNKLGQNRHFIALYLTGYGYERKLLAKGEGRNKVEAGNWAAIEAMYGDFKAIVDQCEAINKADKEKRAAEKMANGDRQVKTEPKIKTEDSVKTGDRAIKTEEQVIVRTEDVGEIKKEAD